MNQYKINKCFWCGAGKGAKNCKMVEALGENHEGKDTFISAYKQEYFRKHPDLALRGAK